VDARDKPGHDETLSSLCLLCVSVPLWVRGGTAP
jgi:hypothetical protein